MNLFEFESKEIFNKYGIPIPRGRVANTPKEAMDIAHEINGPVVIKSQILIAGRGKAGGIKFAKDVEEVFTIADMLLGSKIRGLEVSNLLIEERLRISRELFVSVVVDRFARCYAILTSTEGGINIETVAKESPKEIIRHNTRIFEGFYTYEATEIARRMGYRGKKMINLATIIHSLYHLALDYDAELAEINPLIETKDGEFIAGDARLIIDDNSLFRHPEIKDKAFGREREFTPREAKARIKGLSYVELDGNIGIIGNGAGLVMATLDLIQLYGGEPANFLDMGGGISADSVKLAMDIVLSKPEVDVILINILGGITRCDEVARGVITFLNESTEKKPLVMRIVGNREKEARKMLIDTGIKVTVDLEQAVRRAIELAKG